MRKNNEDWVKQYRETSVTGRKPVEGPRKTWVDNMEKLEIDKREICSEKYVKPYRKTDYNPIIILNSHEVAQIEI